MEFICVLSVSGSLASYHVQSEGENKYKAVLRTNNGKRDDIPSEIYLEKNNEHWESRPSHQEIVSGLIHAIETNC